jgi:hypothetical protein
MYFSSEEEHYRIMLKLSLIALYILSAYNLILIVVGYFVTQYQTVETGSAGAMIRNAFYLLAVGELIATYFVKKSMLRQVKTRNDQDAESHPVAPYADLLKITVVIAVLCSAISTYGLILVALGERLEMLLLFVALSLIGYQFFRLRPRDFNEVG